MRRPALVLTFLLVLVVPLLPVAPAVASGVSWAPCPEDASAECGTLTVPVDWEDPGGPTFELALARRRATDPAARIGSLVINPGGPGGSGVDAVLTDPFGFTPELTSRFDIVGFDPRGVARSNPILCSQELYETFPDPLEVRSQAGFEAMLAFNERYRQDCRARTGPLYDHVHTGQVVRDLEALRSALGERRLTYYGISYGTVIGQLYAERYPGRVRALALDSVVDHSLGTAAFFDAGSWSAQDAFDEFVAWCDRTASCALHGRDVRAVWKDLLARAERGELHWPGEPDEPLSPLNLIFLGFRAFYGPYFRELAAFMAEPDSAGRTVASVLAPAAAPADEAEEVVNDGLPILCQDFRLPVRDYRDWARYLRRSAKIAPDMRISGFAQPVAAYCLGSATPNPQHRLRVTGTPPLLLTGALHDPVTGYPGAVSVARQIGREARLLAYEGSGHGVYFRGPCPAAVIDRYLTTLTVPDRGARCPAVPPEELNASRARPLTVPAPPGWSR
ncbi:alpha/beta fold hydrolase [Nonomuraea sp. NPDC050643]|uniref:alpha/beta fold hydrolase n=1 Tax=Nonomuraea sp. NPDC050643 TaxID=3155660 RepID=UPI00340D95D7